jgi:hypothetical protein
MAKFLKLPVGPSTNGVWTAVAANGNTVVALANTGKFRAARSTDGGVTWSFIELPGTLNKNWTHVAHNGGSTFVAVANSSATGTFHIMRSTDAGQTWALANTDVPEALTCVAWSGARFLAVGTTGTAWKSDTGDIWTAVGGYPVPGALIQSVVWSGTTWIACRNDGAAGTAFITGNAENIASWTAQTGLAGAWIELVRLDTAVVAITSTGGSTGAATGTLDGTTWTVRAGLATGTYVAAASDGTAGMVVLSQIGPGATRITTSADGITFTPRTTPNTDATSQMWSAAASTAANSFVVISSSGGNTNRVAKSSALATWAGYDMSYVNTVETQSPNYYNVENFLYMRPGAQNTVILDLDSANPSSDVFTFTFGSDYSGATHEILMNAIIAANSQELAPAGFFEIAGTLPDGRFIDLQTATVQS